MVGARLRGDAGRTRRAEFLVEFFQGLYLAEFKWNRRAMNRPGSKWKWHDENGRVDKRDERRKDLARATGSVVRFYIDKWNR